MVEDLTNQSNLKHQSVIRKSGKQSKVSKKDLIIQENTKRIQKKKVDADKNTLKFLLDTIDDKHPYDQFETLQTNEAKQIFKWKFLKNILN